MQSQTPKPKAHHIPLSKLHVRLHIGMGQWACSKHSIPGISPFLSTSQYPPRLPTPSQTEDTFQLLLLWLIMCIKLLHIFNLQLCALINAKLPLTAFSLGQCGRFGVFKWSANAGFPINQRAVEEGIKKENKPASTHTSLGKHRKSPNATGGEKNFLLYNVVVDKGRATYTITKITSCWPYPRQVWNPTSPSPLLECCATAYSMEILPSLLLS